MFMSPIAFFSVLMDGPGHFQGDCGVDNSNNDGRDDHGNHSLSGEEAGHHPALRVSPQIHLSSNNNNLDLIS